jgi:hypothetical protein
MAARMMFGTSGGIDSPFSFFFVVLLAVILVATWVILAASRFVQGGVVERPERVPQLYGYTACLVGLLWALTSAVTLVEKVLERTEPALAPTSEFAGWGEPSVTSFEAFRATYDRARRFGPGEAQSPPADSIPEAELRRRFDALRADRIAQARFRTRNAIVTSVFGLVVGSALFLFHWRWLRRRTLDLDGARAARPPAVT